jgi:Holliday junction resolvase RusA-like endonuclease
MFTCTLYGKPLRKRAHKSTRYGGYFDPDSKIKQQLSDYINETCVLPNTPMEGALKIELIAYFKVPKSVNKVEKEKRLANLWASEIRIDLDNSVKLYADTLQYGALEGKIFFDDHQFCEYNLKKYWSETEEYVKIIISKL